MYPTTDEFKTALTKSHTVVGEADLYYNRDPVIRNIPIIAGTVTEDSTAMIRGRVELELAATDEMLDLAPKFAPAGTASLWPLGTELVPRTGIQFASGESELVQQGVFRLSKPRFVETGDDLSISVEGFDRGRTVSRNKFIKPWLVQEGTYYHLAIQRVIQDRLPWISEFEFIFAESEYTTPKLIFDIGDDPWEKCQEMAAAIGMELFFNYLGLCVLRPIPDPMFGDPVWRYVEDETATYLELVRELDDDPGYNGVIVIGQNSSSDTIARGEAWDTDPASPTYFDPAFPELSIYGSVPLIITTDKVFLNSQATLMARSVLTQKTGAMEHVNLTAVNNPAHEAGDLIVIERSTINLDSFYIIESLTKGIGLDADTQATCRGRRTTSDGLGG